MKKVNFIVEMDENLKIAFESWCNNHGMDMSAAINVFARTITEQQKKTFKFSDYDLFGPENASRMLNAARKQAQQNGISDLTIEDIDEEISKVRRGISD